MPLDADDLLERVLGIRAAAIELSPDYVFWLDGDGEDLEPVLPESVRDRMHVLVDAMELLIEGPGLRFDS